MVKIRRFVMIPIDAITRMMCARSDFSMCVAVLYMCISFSESTPNTLMITGWKGPADDLKIHGRILSLNMDFRVERFIALEITSDVTRAVSFTLEEHTADSST